MTVWVSKPRHNDSRFYPMDFSAFLSEQKQNHLYRQRKVFHSPQATILKTNEDELINFCSNDYLGLANDARIIQAYKDGLDHYGVGSGASQLICGYSRAHQELEEALADFTGREKVLLFNNGYVANLGVQQALVHKKSHIFLDRLVHVSIIDAARLSGASIKRYQHNDMDSLQAMLQRSEAKDKFIATDAVFSMDGDWALVPDIDRLAKGHNALWLMDDAHGFAVLGKEGKGLLQHLNLSDFEPDVYLATFGKGLGTFGAFVAADEDIIETMIQKSRSLIYTTALPPALATATLKALQISQEESWRREKLKNLITRFKSSARSQGLLLKESDTAIQVLIIGDADKALRLSEHLLQKKILVSAIRPPTVPKDSSRLRITFSALHTDEQLDQLLQALVEFKG